jgi:hypothetical protein
MPEQLQIGAFARNVQEQLDAGFRCRSVQATCDASVLVPVTSW